MKNKLVNIIGPSGKTLWKILDEWDSSLREFIKVMNKAYREGMISVKDNRIFVTEKYKHLIQPRLRVKRCGRCRGKLIEFREKKLLKKFVEIVKNRPHVKVEYFQGWIRPIDSIRRIALMDYWDGIADKSIVLIGDDDLESIALGLTNLPKRILALDIDENLLDYIERVSKKFRLNIETLAYDVSNPLPKKLLKKFDIFSTEPLETISGCLAFLSRGASLLKGKDCTGYFGLTTLECSFKKWQEIEKELIGMGFVITDIIRNFSEYPMSDPVGDKEYEDSLKRKLPFKIRGYSKINWYKSWLFRIKAIEKIKPKFKWNEKIKIEVKDEDDITYPY